MNRSTDALACFSSEVSLHGTRWTILGNYSVPMIESLLV